MVDITVSSALPLSIYLPLLPLFPVLASSPPFYRPTPRNPTPPCHSNTNMRNTTHPQPPHSCNSRMQYLRYDPDSSSGYPPLDGKPSPSSTSGSSLSASIGNGTALMMIAGTRNAETGTKNGTAMVNTSILPRVSDRQRGVMC